MSENELRKQQVNGFYRDVELSPPGNVEQNSVDKKEKELDGTKKVGKQETMYTLLECHVNLDLEGFEEVGSNGEPTGIKIALHCNCRRRQPSSALHTEKLCAQ